MWLSRGVEEKVGSCIASGDTTQCPVDGRSSLRRSWPSVSLNKKSAYSKTEGEPGQPLALQTGRHRLWGKMGADLPALILLVVSLRGACLGSYAIGRWSEICGRGMRFTADGAIVPAMAKTAGPDPREKSHVT